MLEPPKHATKLHQLLTLSLTPNQDTTNPDPKITKIHDYIDNPTNLSKLQFTNHLYVAPKPRLNPEIKNTRNYTPNSRTICSVIRKVKGNKYDTTH